MARTPKSKTLSAIRPNAGVQEAYQRRIDAMIARMQTDVSRSVLALWKRRAPVMAQDESPAAALAAMMRRLGREWLGRFDEFARRESRRFATQALGSADRAFQGALRKAGFTVRFKMTPAAQDIMTATISEQVGLIRSIPQQYLKDVEGIVMRGVQIGRDAASISEALQLNYDVTQRRAALIARDQNNKATASITKARQLEIGITQAEWLHSAGGRQPRKTHVANSGKTYDVAEGWLDPAEGKRIWPGELINCRCVAKAILPRI
jgi:SPP1 gp7 family putative phage head morphogenesis protein